MSHVLTKIARARDLVDVPILTRIQMNLACVLVESAVMSNMYCKLYCHWIFRMLTRTLVQTRHGATVLPGNLVPVSREGVVLRHPVRQ